MRLRGQHRESCSSFVLPSSYEHDPKAAFVHNGPLMRNDDPLSSSFEKNDKEQAQCDQADQWWSLGLMMSLSPPELHRTEVKVSLSFRSPFIARQQSIRWLVLRASLLRECSSRDRRSSCSRTPTLKKVHFFPRFSRLC